MLEFISILGSRVTMVAQNCSPCTQVEHVEVCNLLHEASNYAGAPYVYHTFGWYI